MPAQQDGILIGSMREFLRASRGKSQKDILTAFLHKVILAGHFSEAGSILVNFPEEKKLRLFNPGNLLTSNGYLREGEPWQAEFKYGEGIAGEAFIQRDSITVADATGDPRFSTAEGQVPITSMICSPIIFNDRSEPFGIASFHNYNRANSFSAESKTYAEICVNVLALALAASSEGLDRKRPGQRRVFVGCATEDLPIARTIQNQLRRSALVQIWTQGAFKSGGYVLETLLRLVKEHDCAIFLLTPNDVVDRRGAKYLVARDNVLFEAGLFYSQLGRGRTFLIVPEVPDLKLPSDLDGLIKLTYEPPNNPDDIELALGPVCNEIIDTLSKPLPPIA
jgi:predicted nucleotide-binding protein